MGIENEDIIDGLIKCRAVHKHHVPEYGMFYRCSGCLRFIGNPALGIPTVGNNTIYFGLEHIFNCVKIKPKKLRETIRERLKQYKLRETIRESLKQYLYK